MWAPEALGWAAATCQMRRAKASIGATAYGQRVMRKQRDKSAENTARKARLAEALKANLKRRKEQARARRNGKPDKPAGDSA